jgi:PA domain-containing protein/RING finger family protein
LPGSKRDIAQPDTDGASEARSVDSDTPERHYRSVDATGRLQRRRLSSIPDVLETEVELFDRTSEIAGKIVLLSRGGCGFLEKVMWAQRRGATALIVGDNQKGGPLIQMFAKGDTSNVTIPSVFTARTTAHLLYSLTQPGSFIMETFDENGRRALSVQQSHWSGAEDEPVEAIPIDTPQATTPRSPVQPEGHQTTWWHKLFGRAAVTAPTPDDLPQDEMDQLRQAGLDLDPLMPEPPEDETPPAHEGLWVTITPSDNGNPFFDTLLVLVVSPLITLTIVYAMLIIRARIRRRRWRAPKSVVEQLPVRTYHTVAPSPIHTPRAPSPVSPSPTTPLLQQPFAEDRTVSWSRSRPGTAAGLSSQESLSPAAAAIPSSRPPPRPEHEKPAGSVPSEWKKYMGRQVECVVCLEEYVDGVSQVMSLPCGHEFHVECM